MVNIRTESPIDTNFSVQIVDNSNFDGSEKNYLNVLIYINGRKVYPGKSSFILHSNNVLVNNVNDLRLIFNRSYIRAIPEKKYLEGEEGTFFWTPSPMELNFHRHRPPM